MLERWSKCDGTQEPLNPPTERYWNVPERTVWLGHCITYGSMHVTTDSVVVSVERPTTPLLWLDTSILIAIARAERGDGVDQRVVDLVKLVHAKRQAGRLVCIESDQPREVEGHPRASSVRQGLRRLTYNVMVRDQVALASFQAAEAMRAYLAGSNEVHLPVRVFFSHDPDAEIRKVNEAGWFLTVDMDMHPEVVSSAKQAKNQLRDDLERLRRKNRSTGQRYEDQLARERDGFLDGQRAVLDRLLRELSSRNPDPMTLLAGSPLHKLGRTWAALGGDAAGLLEFFGTDHFLQLPCNDIPHRLYAQLLTIDREVESGDAMDIEHMSAALPVATWVLTDRSLASRVQQLGLDSDWGCSVQSLRSIDDLLQQLVAL